MKARSGAITSWRLVSGRGQDRERLSLGRVSEDTAARCLVGMQAQEERTAGTPAYVLPHLKSADPETVVRFLTDDPAVAGDPFADVAPDYASMTVAEYFDTVYWPARTDPTSPIGVAEATATAEAVYWRQPSQRRGILDSEIGTTRLRDLTDQMWEQWQEAQPLSGRSKVLRRNAYASLLSWARRQGHNDYNPEFWRIRGSTKRTRKQSETLSPDEVIALLDASDPMRRAMWAVGIGQGLRPGELVRVHWQDIRWRDQTMLIRGTKTAESWTVVPLTPFALRELRAYWMLQGQPAEGRAFLWKGRAFKEFKGALTRCAAAAGINRKVYPYLLRHSFATLAWALGVPKDVARRVMRHTNELMSTTLPHGFTPRHGHAPPWGPC